MKKILPFILMAVLMIFAVAQTSEAQSFASAEYFNGDYVEFWPSDIFDGYAHVVLTYASDGNTYATALTPDGWPDSYYYQMYLSSSGFLYCSEDGYYWFLCS